jgi:hypothetical protein
VGWLELAPVAGGPRQEPPERRPAFAGWLEQSSMAGLRQDPPEKQLAPVGWLELPPRAWEP